MLKAAQVSIGQIELVGFVLKHLYSHGIGSFHPEPAALKDVGLLFRRMRTAPVLMTALDMVIAVKI